eukprot:jgi/Bigna1/145985/aug1.107_g20693
MSLDEVEIRRQDTISVICAVSRNAIGQGIAWEFLQTRWEEIHRRYSSLSFELGTLLKCVVGGFAGASSFRLDIVKGFFSGRDVGAAAQALEQVLNTADRVLEEAHGNAAFLERNERELGSWLRAQIRHKTRRRA